MKVVAGLLTFRSIYFPRLPDLFGDRSVALADFVPEHSGGSAPEFHRFPCLALKGTTTLHEQFCLVNRQPEFICQGISFAKIHSHMKLYITASIRSVEILPAVGLKLDIRYLDRGIKRRHTL